jgi:Fe-S oxidoreductase
VLLWDDTWTRYHEARIGRAAVAVLEAVGYEVGLVEDRRCCGRPAASRGLLDDVARLGRHNLALLAGGDEPIVFLEPSCFSIFVDEYRQLGLAGADLVAGRCVLIEDLLIDRFEGGDVDPPARSDDALIVGMHGHCHTKALARAESGIELLARLPGVEVRGLDVGCCGMAGAFGMLEANRELSRAVAGPLIAAIRSLPDGAMVVAAGTSCRHQIEHLAEVPAHHPVEIVARALDLG